MFEKRAQDSKHDPNRVRPQSSHLHLGEMGCLTENGRERTITESNVWDNNTYMNLDKKLHFSVNTT